MYDIVCSWNFMQEFLVKGWDNKKKKKSNESKIVRARQKTSLNGTATTVDCVCSLARSRSSDND